MGISYDDATDDEKENRSICGSLLCSQAPFAKKKPIPFTQQLPVILLLALA
jgi:hypothetical protein